MSQRELKRAKLANQEEVWSRFSSLTCVFFFLGPRKICFRRTGGRSRRCSLSVAPLPSHFASLLHFRAACHRRSGFFFPRRFLSTSQRVLVFFSQPSSWMLAAPGLKGTSRHGADARQLPKLRAWRMSDGAAESSATFWPREKRTQRR